MGTEIFIPDDHLLHPSFELDQTLLSSAGKSYLSTACYRIAVQKFVVNKDDTKFHQLVSQIIMMHGRIRYIPISRMFDICNSSILSKRNVNDVFFVRDAYGECQVCVAILDGKKPPQYACYSLDQVAHKIALPKTMVYVRTRFSW